MASQTCETCGYSNYTEAEFQKHADAAPQSCIRHMRDRAVAAEAKNEAYIAMQRDMSEKFMQSVERIAQLLAPDAAKKLEKFVSSRGY